MTSSAAAGPSAPPQRLFRSAGIRSATNPGSLRPSLAFVARRTRRDRSKARESRVPAASTEWANVPSVALASPRACGRLSHQLEWIGLAVEEALRSCRSDGRSTSSHDHAARASGPPPEPKPSTERRRRSRAPTPRRADRNEFTRQQSIPPETTTSRRWRARPPLR